MKKYKQLPYFFVLLFIVISALFIFPLFSENAKFEKYTNDFFEKELSSSLLSFHYTIAHPEKEGLKRPAATLGSEDIDIEAATLSCKTQIEELQKFNPEKLSRQNQITYDTLFLHLKKQLTLSDFFLLEEPLGPSLGIQAQLPVLLAEYAFYKKQDIIDYLNLLCSIDTYFDSIIAFEKKKSDAGFFMNEETLNRIQEQCLSFIKNPDSNYMLEIFEKKLKQFGGFSTNEEQKIIAKHQDIIIKKVIPAYEKLITELEKLREFCTLPQGLYYYKNGRAYYEYLLFSQVGTTDSISVIENTLSQKLTTDTKEISELIKKYPSLISSLSKIDTFLDMSPKDALLTLKKLISNDFPDVSAIDFDIRYVHDSMEDFLSPAFYLTPPIDTGKPNIIYINPAQKTNHLELFCTLAHEGFPGHMYQTIFFQNTSPSKIQNLLSYGGYTEGWATYIEPYACFYASKLMDTANAQELCRLAWLNKSVNLCIYSLIDIGIHYNGWNELKTSLFLKAFGITDPHGVHEIYMYILESPTNYLKYYYGYLNFLKLRNMERQHLKENFDLKAFHEKILKIGPVPFPILKKYLI